MKQMFFDDDDYFYYKNLITNLAYEKAVLREELLEEMVIHDRIMKNMIYRSTNHNPKNKFNNPQVKKMRY